MLEGESGLCQALVSHTALHELSRFWSRRSQVDPDAEKKTGSSPENIHRGTSCTKHQNKSLNPPGATGLYNQKPQTHFIHKQIKRFEENLKIKIKKS